MKKLILLTAVFTFLLAPLPVSAAQAELLPRVSGQSAWSKPKSAADTKLRAVNYTERETATVRFKPMDQLKINEMRARNATIQTKVMQIGVHRDARVDAATLRDPVLLWKPAAGGGLVARLAIASPGALAIRAGLNIRAIPAGAEMRFSGPNNGQSAAAMVGAEEIKRLSREQPIYWTPVTEGEQQIIEIYLPPGVAAAALRFTLDSVSHLIVSPSGRLNNAKLGEAQSCNRDVACAAQTPGLAKVAESVARMVFTGQCGAGGSTASCLCTGTLLNDFDPSTQVPYFITANHCISTQSEAGTLTTFWGYESSTCGSGDLKSTAIQVSGGASLLFSDSTNDATLLKLNSPAPAGAYFSGWDPNAVNINDAISVIHHPGGDVKKVSMGQVMGASTAPGLGGTFTEVGFTNGSTQAGSSGSGLFTTSNGEFFLRGALYGGWDSCSNSGNIADSNNRAYFSKLDQIYPALRTYLAPGTAGSAYGAYSNTPAPAPAPAPSPPSSPSTTTTTTQADLTGAWQSSSEPGWGLSVIRGASGALGVIMFHYTPSRAPVWYILLNGSFNGNVFSGQLNQFTGPGLNEAYNGALVQYQPVGTASITFSGTDTATISYNVTGVGSATKNITKASY